MCAAPNEQINFESRVGAVYVIYGGPQLPDQVSDQDIGTAVVPGIKLVGAAPLGQLGDSISAGGDFDGDAAPDYLITSAWSGRTGLAILWNAIYLVNGTRSFSHELSVNAVSPAVGSIDGGDTITIKGAGFSGGEKVSFGERESTSVEVLSSSELRVILPSAPQPRRVAVTVFSRGSSSSLPDGFEYVAVPRFPDLVMNSSGLRDAPYRTLFYEFPIEPSTFGARVFASTVFGDVNGDGIDDLVIGQRLSGWEVDGNPRRAQATIIFGRRDLPSHLSEGDLPGYGSVIHGEIGRGALASDMALLGDRDGDGLNDFALLDEGGAAQGYVLLGRHDWPEQAFLEDDLGAGTAIPIRLDVIGCAPGQLTSAGDLDKDGAPDFLVGNSGCEGELGSVKIYRDDLKPGARLLEPTSRITGDPALVELLNSGKLARVFGSAVAAGDLNGDGTLDIAVGAAHATGEINILLGSTWDFPVASELEFFELRQGVRLRRDLALSDLGKVLSLAPDFNGDGLSDLIVGMPGGGMDFHGETAVVFGSDRLGVEVDTIDLDKDTERRLILLGEYPYDRSGYAESIGDFNGDGLTDVGIVNIGFHNRVPRAHVVFGTSTPPELISLGALGVHGFSITGTQGCWFSSGGHGISSGDLDGDGFLDLAIGGRCEASAWVLVIFGGLRGNNHFLRGEVNGDNEVNLSDVIAILGYLFLGGPTIKCLDAADVNDNGSVDLSDPVYLLGHLFLGTVQPLPPFPGPGVDPTVDTLSCE